MNRPSTAVSVILSMLSVAALMVGVWLNLRASTPQVPRSTGASTVHERPAGTTRSGASRLPSTLAPVVMQTLQAASGASYHVVATPSASATAPVTSFEAPNPAQAFTTRFDSRGLTIHPNAASRQPLGLRLAAYGSSELST